VLLLALVDAVDRFIFPTLLELLELPMNQVQQPRTLLVRGVNTWMSTDAGADELVEIAHEKTPTPLGPT
jgi:hypothetical protein